MTGYKEIKLLIFNLGIFTASHFQFIYSKRYTQRTIRGSVVENILVMVKVGTVYTSIRNACASKCNQLLFTNSNYLCDCEHTG